MVLGSGEFRYVGVGGHGQSRHLNFRGLRVNWDSRHGDGDSGKIPWEGEPVCCQQRGCPGSRGALFWLHLHLHSWCAGSGGAAPWDLFWQWGPCLFASFWNRQQAFLVQQWGTEPWSLKCGIFGEFPTEEPRQTPGLVWELTFLGKILRSDGKMVSGGLDIETALCSLPCCRAAHGASSSLWNPRHEGPLAKIFVA